MMAPGAQVFDPRAFTGYKPVALITTDKDAWR